MARITSLSVLRTLVRYSSFRESQEDQGHRIYQAIADLLEVDPLPPAASTPRQKKAPSTEKSAAESTPEEKQLEEKKQQRFVGKGGMAEAFSRAFKDMIEDYMPGGYFTWTEEAREIAGNFYRFAYKGIKELLPRILSYKIRRDEIADVQPGDVQIDAETINRVITDMVLHYNENPDKLKSRLTKSFSKREKAEGQDRKELGVAQAYFRPRMDPAEYKRVTQEHEEGGGEGRRPTDLDTGVLQNLEERESVNWSWKGIDENGRLMFTLPDLYGKRVFQVKLPPDIQNIRSGNYTFKVVNVGKRGVVLEFVEQRGAIQEDTLKSIEESGLGKDQLRQLINGMVSEYMSFLRSQDTEKLVEDFSGQVAIRGVGNIEDLAELAETGEGRKEEKARGEKEIKEKRRELLEQQRDKIRAVVDTWGPTLAGYFLKFREEDGKRLTEAIASKYPERSTKATPGLQSILSTEPVVRLVLRIIMSPTTPLAGKGKTAPWIRVAVDTFKQAAVRDPAIRDQVVALVQSAQAKGKTPAGPTPAQQLQEHFQSPAQGQQPSSVTPAVDNATIKAFLDNISGTIWAARFKDTKDSIRKTMEGMREDPVLRKFYERREQFQSYIKQDLEEEIQGKLQAANVPVDKVPEYLDSRDGKKLVQDTTRKFIDRRLHQMTRRASASDLYMIRRALRRVR